MSHDPECTNVPHGEKWPWILVPGLMCRQENVFRIVSVERSNSRIRLSLEMRIKLSSSGCSEMLDIGVLLKCVNIIEWHTLSLIQQDE
jgi:predicted ATPase